MYSHQTQPLEDDQCAGLARRHVHARLNIWVEIDCVIVLNVVTPEEYSFAYRVAAELGLCADKQQKFAYFGLEYDDEGDKTDVDDLVENAAGKMHAQCVGHAPKNVDDDNRPKDANDVGAFSPTIDFVKKCCNQKNVNQVCEPMIYNHIEILYGKQSIM